VTARKGPAGVTKEGDRLWFARSAAGKTLDQMVELSGGAINRPNWIAIEKGRVGISGVKSLSGIATAFGVTLEEMRRYLEGGSYGQDPPSLMNGRVFVRSSKLNLAPSQLDENDGGSSGYSATVLERAVGRLTLLEPQRGQRFADVARSLERQNADGLTLDLAISTIRRAADDEDDDNESAVAGGKVIDVRPFGSSGYLDAPRYSNRQAAIRFLALSYPIQEVREAADRVAVAFDSDEDLPPHDWSSMILTRLKAARRNEGAEGLGVKAIEDDA